ncbi:MAG: hypothetical protein FWC69_02705 [Defluviitaleaceae bacterium]|nr:hypothetical protein [Defluviitaleaceae bacterium]
MTKLLDFFVKDNVQMTKRGYIINYRRVVRAMLHTFELDERFYIGCSCMECGRQSFIPSWEIADALQGMEALKCICDAGVMLPTLKHKEAQITA